MEERTHECRLKMCIRGEGDGMNRDWRQDESIEKYRLKEMDRRWDVRLVGGGREGRRGKGWVAVNAWEREGGHWVMTLTPPWESGLSRVWHLVIH